MNYRELYEMTVTVLLKYSAKHGESLNITTNSLTLLRDIQEQLILTPILQDKIEKFQCKAEHYLNDCENLAVDSYKAATDIKVPEIKKTPITSLIRQSLNL